MIYGRHRDGLWTADTGQSGAGYHIMTWYLPSDEGGTYRHWRITVEMDGVEGHYEHRSAHTDIQFLLVFFKDKIREGLMTHETVAIHCDLVLPPGPPPPGFGRFA